MTDVTDVTKATETAVKYRPLWQSQRGMLLVIAMVLLSFLAIFDSFERIEIDPVVLTAFTAGVGGGFAYFFKAKTDEAKKHQ